MSREDSAHLLGSDESVTDDSRDDDLALYYENEQPRPLGTGPNVPTAQRSCERVRVGSQPPNMRPLSAAQARSSSRGSAPAPRRGQRTGRGAVVYGDGNVFIGDEQTRMNSACCGGLWVRWVIAIAMVTLIAVLLLTITGVLPIGLGTHQDTIAGAQHTKQSSDLTAQPPAVGNTGAAARGPLPAAQTSAPRRQASKLTGEEVMNEVLSGFANARKGQSAPKKTDAGDIAGTALQNANEILKNAGVGGINPIEEAIAKQAIHKAVDNALDGAQGQRQDTNGRNIDQIVQEVETAVGGKILAAAPIQRCPPGAAALNGVSPDCAKAHEAMAPANTAN